MTSSFVIKPTHRSPLLLPQFATRVEEKFLSLPPTDKALTAQIKIEVSDGKKLVEVRASVPFGLDLEPQNGRAVITKDSGTNGSRKGDVLRYCSQFTMGLPRGDGLVTTVGSFGGAIGWQCSLFNVQTAQSWDQVVEALVSNTEQRTDYCLLVFEREDDKSN